MPFEIKEQNMLELAEYKRSLWKKPDLRHLFFELTDRCNLHCRHCGSGCSENNHIFLEFAVIEKTLRSVAERYEPGRIMINLTGGEPMIYKNIFDVISLAKGLGFYVGITTNGTLIDLVSAQRLVYSGLDTIAVSLDGIGSVHDNFRHVPGCYTSALLGIRALKRAGIEPEILTVVHKGNLSQLGQMYDLVRRMDIYSWRVVNIEPIGRAARDKSLLLEGKDLKQLFGFIQDKRFDNANPVDVNYGCSHFVTFPYEHMIRDFYFQCGAGTTVGSVMANGDIGACLDIQRTPGLIQGNAYTDDFVDVWENRFRAFRFDRSDQCSECKKCTYKTVCMGDSAHTWDFEKQQPAYCAAKLLEE